MIARLHELSKLDIALEPQALNNSNDTGRYFSLKAYRRVLFVLLGGAMAATKTTALQIMEAKDAAGTDAQALTGALATITANAAVSKATVALASVLATQTVTINGVTFTAHATTTTAANREFSISGNDSADADELVSLINNATYGVPGVTASNNAGTITLTVDDPGETTLTITASDSTFTLATVEAVSYVEIENYDLSDGFTHVAAKATTTANTTLAVLLLRAPARELPVTQNVGAGTTL